MNYKVVIALAALLVAFAPAAFAETFDIECVYSPPSQPNDTFEVNPQGPSISEVVPRSWLLTSETLNGRKLEWTSTRSEPRGMARLHYVLDLDTLELLVSGEVTVDREGDLTSERAQASCKSIPPPATAH